LLFDFCSSITLASKVTTFQGYFFFLERTFGNWFFGPQAPHLVRDRGAGGGVETLSSVLGFSHRWQSVLFRERNSKIAPKKKQGSKKDEFPRIHQGLAANQILPSSEPIFGVIFGILSRSESENSATQINKY